MNVITEPQPLSVDQVKSAVEKSLSPKLIDRQDKFNGLNDKNLKTVSVFSYKLETLLETRSLTEKIEPYDGQPIDGSENGPIPDVWDAKIDPPGNFREKEMIYLMPHSEEVHACRTCDGEGKVYCFKCSGKRRFSVVTTTSSDVKRRKPCFTCKVSGIMKCSVCSGVGSFKSSQLMTVSWIKLSDQTYSGKCVGDLTPGRLTKVKGVLIKSDWGSRISPLNDYPVPEVARLSQLLHEKHRSLIPDARIVEQRQTVEQIPVTIVDYGSNGSNHRRSSCYVYGREMHVFLQDESTSGKLCKWLGSCAFFA